MKNTLKYIVAFATILLFGACSNDENEVVADFLDGTQYGVMLDVNVTSAKNVSETNLDKYSLIFDVKVKGDRRLIESILVSKTFVNGEDGVSSTAQGVILTQFPQTLNLSLTNLVEGFTDLSVSDLNAKDSFKIHFAIKYNDGLIVDRFDPSMRTNFTVLITD